MDQLKESTDADVLAKLKAFHDAFAALPGIKEYLDKRPAKFGMEGSKAAALE